MTENMLHHIQAPISEMLVELEEARLVSKRVIRSLCQDTPPKSITPHFTDVFNHNAIVQSHFGYLKTSLCQLAESLKISKRYRTPPVPLTTLIDADKSAVRLALSQSAEAAKSARDAMIKVYNVDTDKTLDSESVDDTSMDNYIYVAILGSLTKDCEALLRQIEAADNPPPPPPQSSNGERASTTSSPQTTDSAPEPNPTESLEASVPNPPDSAEQRDDTQDANSDASTLSDSAEYTKQTIRDRHSKARRHHHKRGKYYRAMSIPPSPKRTRH